MMPFLFNFTFTFTFTFSSPLKKNQLYMSIRYLIYSLEPWPQLLNLAAPEVLGWERIVRIYKENFLLFSISCLM